MQVTLYTNDTINKKRATHALIKVGLFGAIGLPTNGWHVYIWSYLNMILNIETLIKKFNFFYFQKLYTITNLNMNMSSVILRKKEINF